ncbi:MAG: hypothetical protein HYV07_03520 [Deltaproteobacteria bacterium]|nr:hypothetical protein [Deltaproteobacteria bacterium]
MLAPNRLRGPVVLVIVRPFMRVRTYGTKGFRPRVGVAAMAGESAFAVGLLYVGCVPATVSLDAPCDPNRACVWVGSTGPATSFEVGSSFLEAPLEPGGAVVEFPCDLAGSSLKELPDGHVVSIDGRIGNPSAAWRLTEDGARFEALVELLPTWLESRFEDAAGGTFLGACRRFEVMSVGPDVDSTRIGTVIDGFAIIRLERPQDGGTMLARVRFGAPHEEVSFERDGAAIAAGSVRGLATHGDELLVLTDDAVDPNPRLFKTVGAQVATSTSIHVELLSESPPLAFCPFHSPAVLMTVSSEPELTLWTTGPRGKWRRFTPSEGWTELTEATECTASERIGQISISPGEAYSIDPTDHRSVRRDDGSAVTVERVVGGTDAGALTSLGVLSGQLVAGDTFGRLYAKERFWDPVPGITRALSADVIVPAYDGVLFGGGSSELRQYQLGEGLCPESIVISGRGVDLALELSPGRYVVSAGDLRPLYHVRERTPDCGS